MTATMNTNGTRRKPGPRNPGPTQAQQQAMIEAAERGATNRDVAQMLGIAESTFYRWISHPDLGDFGDAYTRAKATGRFRSVQIIADSTDWRAHAWLLERMDPTHWGKGEIDGDTTMQKVAAFLASRREENED